MSFWNLFEDFCDFVGIYGVVIFVDGEFEVVFYGDGLD